MNLKGELTHTKNQLRNKTLSEERRKELKTEVARLETDVREKTRTTKKEIIALRSQLPPPKPMKSSRASRIAARKHFCKWAAINKLNHKDIKKILKHLPKNYKLKPAEYRAENTIENFTDEFCEAMGAAHEEVSVKIAHILLKIEIKDGYEFEYLPIYRDEEIDEFMVILVNAIKLSSIRSNVKPSVTGVTIPGAATRKI